jgi:formate/nitrite transporter
LRVLWPADRDGQASRLADDPPLLALQRPARSALVSAPAGGHTETGSAIDALLPPAIARRAEEIGVAKIAMAPTRLLALAVLAGAFIALGGAFATTAAAGADPAPWGIVRVVVGIAFSLGLILVLVGGAELFTGNNLIVMAWASGRVGIGALLRSWAIVFAGNALGAIATAAVICVAGVHRYGGGAWGVAAISTASSKLELGFGQAIALGLLCNALVCLAIWLAFSARTTSDRILAIVPPVSAFVAIGFEHSIANLYFVPLAIFVAGFDPAFIAARGVAAQAGSLTWSGFVLHNLVPVTLGNVLGGSLLVGAVYWFVYLQPRRAATAGE